MSAQKQGLALFVIVAFGFSWAIAIAIYLVGGFETLGPWIGLFQFSYMCGPAIAAIVCILLFDRSRWQDALGLKHPNWKEMPWAWTSGILLLGGALLITLSVPGYEAIAPMTSLELQIKHSADTMSTRDLTMAQAQLETPFIGVILFMMSLIIGPAINAIMTLSEELGWRGYLWDQLKGHGFWMATLIIGLLWGLWHMPIIWLGHNYPDAPLIGSLLFILLCMLMSPVYSWLRITTGSIWGPGLFHGTTNGAASYFILMQNPQDQPWQGLLGIGGFTAATISAICIWLVWRKAKPSLG